jgi:hypothetical protein
MEELRIGLVLYGGVALAVYINGVVTEIWQAQRASRAMQDGEDTNLDSASGIYRDLLADLKASSDADELRIVLDAVTGTSAGGVNGAAMFKAIVEGADASVLNDVWLNDADIKNLQDDPGSMPWYLRAAENLLRIFPTLKNARKGLREQTTVEWTWIRDTVYTLVTTKDSQKSPLKGDFLTTIIAASLRRMSENKKSEPRHVRSASDPDRPAQLAPPPAGKPSLSSDGSVRTDPCPCDDLPRARRQSGPTRGDRFRPHLRCQDNSRISARLCVGHVQENPPEISRSTTGRDGAVGRQIRRYAFAGTPPERFRYQESPHGKWRGARQPSVCPCYPGD